MKYVSLNNPSIKVSFKDAVLMGQAPEKGLFFPEYIPEISRTVLENIQQYPKEELAFEILRPYIGDCINAHALKNILADTLNFDFPLKEIEDSIFVLELFHGPTAAFKDVGARFLSRCLQYFSKDNNEKFTILVATSGDTGGAVADAFFGLENVDVIILFPSGKVSELQKMQLTTYGNNITALEVEGTFDDCQAMVKQAFADESLKSEYQFTSANSINIARWIAQQVYYALALQQWPLKEPPVISVPSGNLGNLAAGMLAAAGGLPVSAFVAACNENRAIIDYIETDIFNEHETIPTISNAMDVGNPSNFKRIVRLLKQKNMRSLKGYSFNSAETKTAIQEVFRQTGYIMDPHGAVGYLGLKHYLKEMPERSGFFLETAHPAKFDNIVNPLVNGTLQIPERFYSYQNKKSVSIRIAPDYTALKKILL